MIKKQSHQEFTNALNVKPIKAWIKNKEITIKSLTIFLHVGFSKELLFTNVYEGSQQQEIVKVVLPSHFRREKLYFDIKCFYRSSKNLSLQYEDFLTILKVGIILRIYKNSYYLK